MSKLFFAVAVVLAFEPVITHGPRWRVAYFVLATGLAAVAWLCEAFRDLVRRA